MRPPRVNRNASPSYGVYLGSYPDEIGVEDFLDLRVQKMSACGGTVRDVQEESVLRSDLSSASASSIFFKMSGSPFSSARVVHGTRFIASTAASSSPDSPCFCFFPGD